MSTGNRRTATLVGSALLLGVAADIVARTLPERLSLTVWIGLSLLVGFLLVRFRVVSVPRASFLLAGAALLFAIGIAGRDAEALGVLDLLAALSLIVLAAPRSMPARLGAAGVIDYARAAIHSAASSLAGLVPAAVMDVDWRAVPVNRRSRTLGAALAGLALVVPVLLIFGSLLAQADPLFERALRSLLIVNLDWLLPHVATIGVATWLVAGFLRWGFVGRPYEGPLVPTSGRIGFPAIGAAIGAVAVLFLAFVAVEARYMFAGESLVRSLTGMSYAEYARRGFFELTWVTGLSVPLLLLADWLLDRSDIRGVRAFRGISATVILLLAVILGSAFFRMRLYVSAYGQTELRLYVTAFMLLLAAALLWFALTVLRGHRERFATGVFVLALLTLAGLNLVNPDAMIARTNLARAGDARFDAGYLTSLSADALPVIEAALPGLPAGTRCAVSRGLARRWDARHAGSAWSLSRARATDAVARARAGEERGCT